MSHKTAPAAGTASGLILEASGLVKEFCRFVAVAKLLKAVCDQGQPSLVLCAGPAFL